MKLFKKLAHVDALAVDDFALAPMDEHVRRDFLDTCDDRYLVRSTVLNSQLPVDQRHEPIGDPSVADSILDRMVHLSHGCDLSGESLQQGAGPQASGGRRSCGPVPGRSRGFRGGRLMR